ncbi:MAG: hypothetical protein WAT22_17745 [Saprospiraceae bacterium]
MKAFKLFFIILMFPIGLFAQSETMPVILVSADGKVTYQDNSKLNVIPGSIMKKSGSLIVSPKGKAIVYHNYMFVEVSGDQSPISLDKLFVDDQSLVSKSELSFGEKMSDAVYNASISGVKMKNQKDLVSGWGDKTGSGKDGWGDKTGSGKDGWGDKTGSGKDGWGDKTGSGKDGWGDKDIRTRSSCPGGKYVEDVNVLSWEPLKGTKIYTFVIEDMEHNLIYTTQVKGQEYALNSKVAKLKNGTKYAWYIHHPTKKEVSTPVFFSIVSKEMEDKTLKSVQSADIYKKSNADIRLLMEAHQMEGEGFLLSAQTKYKKAIVMSPKNSLPKMMYSLFCKNMNEVESAVKALK